MSRVEFPITYLPQADKEFLPTPKFQGIYWQDFLEGDIIKGQQVELNQQYWTIDVVGFQGTDKRGSVRMHQEPTQQEDVFFISGIGEMTIWNGMDCVRDPNDRNYWEHPLNGVMSIEEANDAHYVLAVASDIHTGYEKLVLNTTSRVGKMCSIEPVSTRVGMHHSTNINTPSIYFVVKRSPQIQDLHDLLVM